MFSHPELGLDPSIGSDRESGCDISSRFIGRKWAPIPAVMATFIVSAVMHELIFFYTRMEPEFLFIPS